jgi:hypothetical protein
VIRRSIEANRPRVGYRANSNTTTHGIDESSWKEKPLGNDQTE